MVVPSSQDGGDFESRFAHLVKPIRDLTKNWNMNIAGDLDEYLEEIGNIQVTFDGGATTMNFAEAALLIQGSACIFSKKVEYLYTLVNQMLDLLASKKKMAQAGSVDAEGADTDATFHRKKDADDEFLSLDDIKEHKNLDVHEDLDGEITGISLLQHIPIAMLPLADSEKGEHPLLSTKGEVLGNRKDFRMNTSVVHSGGTMILDLSNLDILDMSFRFKPHSTPFPTRTQPTTTSDTEAALPMECAQQLDMEENEGFPDPLDDDNEAMPFEPPENDTIVHQQTLLQQTIQRQQQGNKRTGRILPKPLAAPEYDALKLREVYSDTTKKHKAFKKMKKQRIPPQLSNTSRKRKRDIEIEPGQQHTLFTFLNKYVHNSKEKQPRKTLKANAFSEFEQLYWKEFQRRQALDRNNRKKMVEQGRIHELIAEVEEQAELEEDGNYVGDPGGDDDNFEAPDLGGLNLEDGNLPPLFNNHPAELDAIGDGGFDDHMGAVDMAGDNYGEIVTSYEELVRQHVEGFMESANQYAQVSDLHKRVQAWEERVLPILQDEDERDPYDIHKSGTKVLTKLSDKVKQVLDCTEHRTKKTQEKEIRIPFKKVAECYESSQVPRLFLSTLLLANNYNIHIERVTELEHRMDSMTLQLLSTTRMHEQLQDYQAPSLDSQS